MTRGRLLLAVVLLEVASGLPYGVVADLVPVWLRVRGTDLAALGAVTLVGLPWTLKALWAPLVDRHGSFRAWMMAGLLGAAAATALLPAAPDLGVVVALLVAVALFSATQDVAIDGWLVAAVPPGEQGRATGFRVAAYRAAMAVAGGGTVVIGDRLGWSWAFGAATVAMALLLVVQARLPAVARPAASPTVHWLGELRAWLTQAGAPTLFAFVLLYKLGDSAMGPMVKPYLLDAGLTPGEVGVLSTTVGAVFVSIGALLGGDVVSRFGLARGAVALGGLQAVSNLGYAAAAWTGGRIPAYTASIVESLTSGLGTAALMAALMRAAEGSQGATRFAMLTALVGLTRTLAGAISGVAVERVGYGQWFALTFLLALPALGLAPVVGRRLERAAA